MKGCVLGAGFAGLSAGLASGFPIVEASDHAGGICRSYDIRPAGRPANPGDSYRFEVGGGHWIHTRHRAVADFLRALQPLEEFERRSAVYLQEDDLLIPYPLQDHIDLLPPRVAAAIADERACERALRGPTMRDAFEQQFGPTLCDLFFHPFHERYTAGLYSAIAPRDAYKTPAPRDASARAPADARGYNAHFFYPRGGFTPLVERMTEQVAIEYGRRVTEIDTVRNRLSFSQGTVAYDTLISTLPLHVMQRLTGIATREEPDPWTSVLVINIGGTRGPRCPDAQWVYLPRSVSGCHRVGIYSNVSRGFLPAITDGVHRVSFYAECSYPPGEAPAPPEIDTRCAAVAAELQAMGWLGETEVTDPTWVDVAYTWRRPGSTWVEELSEHLRRNGIIQAGRYATWQGFGIADSIRDGFLRGRALADSSHEHDSDAFRALMALTA